MQVYVRGDRAHFRAEPCNLVRKHAGGRRLDRVVPVVVVVAESVSEVQDRHLRDVRRVFCHVEMRRFNTALSHTMWYQEEVEPSINHFRLLYEALVHIGTLGWVVDEGLPILLSLLEESLANTLVDNNQSDLGCGQLLLGVLVVAVLLVDDLV